MGKTGVLIKNENISLEDRTNITIFTSNQSIEIINSSADTINVSQYGDPDAKSKDMYSVTISDEGINISIERDSFFQWFNFNRYQEKLLIEIPESFHGNLTSITSSGSINIDYSFELNNIKFNSSSGSIRLNNTIKANTLDIKTSSGGISTLNSVNVIGNIILKSSSGSIRFEDNLNANNLIASSSSGWINLGDVNVGDYDLQSSSGSIRVGSISGGGNVRTSSGSINLSLNNPKGEISLRAGSGSIRLGLEPELEFSILAKTSSGSVFVNFPVENKKSDYLNTTIGDNPIVSITANAGSGSIRIEK